MDWFAAENAGTISVAHLSAYLGLSFTYPCPVVQSVFQLVLNAPKDDTPLLIGGELAPLLLNRRPAGSKDKQNYNDNGDMFSSHRSPPFLRPSVQEPPRPIRCNPSARIP